MVDQKPGDWDFKGGGGKRRKSIPVVGAGCAQAVGEVGPQ